jgi:beta-fructofuranosidase
MRPCRRRRRRSLQSDVEVEFAIGDLSKAERFNPRWLTDPQALCKKRGARETGEVGPFGLWVLAAGDLTERTAVFFRVFRANSNSSSSRLVVLMCNDPTNSTFEAQVYRPTFASFVNVDIARTKTIALRTLVRRVCVRARVHAAGHRWSVGMA